MEYSERTEIAYSLLGKDIYNSDPVQNMPLWYETIDEAYEGIGDARFELIPKLRYKTYLDRAVERGGANCIASGIVACAFALRIKNPVINPIFVMQGGSARSLLVDEEGTVLRLTHSRRDRRSIQDSFRLPRPIDLAIAEHHMSLPEGRRALHVESHNPESVDSNGYRVLLPHEIAPDGFANGAIQAEPILSVSGQELVMLGQAALEWYSFKTSKFVDDQKVLEQINPDLIPALPWRKSKQ